MDTNQDEFQVLKEELKKLNIEVQKVVKVGNGCTDFHEVFYKSPRFNDVKTVYVQHRTMNHLIERFKEVYK